MTISRRGLLIAGLSIASVSWSFGAEKAPSAATPLKERDWGKNPAIVVLPQSPDVFALGDVHADCDRLLEVLAGGRLISVTKDSSGNLTPKWIGGKAVLVITGDFIDKYTQAVRVVAALRQIQAQAAEAGGRVVVCLGNHEAEFLAAGGMDKKAAEFAAELTRAGVTPQNVAAGKDALGIGAWLRQLPVGAKVGDWFFCHAGNTGGKTLVDLEAELEKELTEKGYATDLLLDPNSMLEARMHPRQWWDAEDPALHDVDTSSSHHKKPAAMGAGNDNAAAPAKLVEVVKALGARHLVIGHQPGEIRFTSDGAIRAKGEMFEHYRGLFFMIDVGTSRGVASGRGALLYVRTRGNQTTAAAVYHDGLTRVLWRN